MSKSGKYRRRRGSAIVLGVALAFVLVLLGGAYFMFTLYSGGANETKNATDAGALNIGREVVDDTQSGISVSAQSSDEQFYADVANSQGQFNLRNINRVWAKAMLVAINAKAAGSNAGDTGSNVQSAVDGAKSLSDRLTKKLNDQGNLTTFFNNFAGANSVRMLGLGVKVEPLTGGGQFAWSTSCLNRGDESNIEVVDNLPVGYTLPGEFETASTRHPLPSGASGKQFLKGYVPMEVQDQTFWQVPFQFDMKPHLVAGSTFEKNMPATLPLDGWDTPLPNSFKALGKASKNNAVEEKASSWVQSNPRQTFPVQFPNGFIRVTVAQNDMNWYLDGIPMDSSNYDHSPDEEESGDGFPYPLVPICATAGGDAQVGLEYVPPVLYIALCGNSPPRPGNTMANLLQRCKEMVPTMTMTKLTGILMACPLIPDSDSHDYLIYPVGGQIVATPSNAALLPPGCDSSAHAEGTSQSLDSDMSIIPNFATETFTCNGVPGPPFPIISSLTMDRSWKPGTGKNGGCLGEFTIHHTEDAYVLTLPCTCPP